MGWSLSFLPWLFTLVLLCSLGCETEVSSLVDTDRYFSLYGVVDPRADSQAVVVFPIENTLRPLPADPLDARFVSTDLEAGVSRVWQDSIMQRNDGAVHVFWSPFRAEYGHNYRIEVTRSDGVRSQVEVRVPPFAELVLQPPATGFPVRQDVRVTAPIERLNNVQVRYWIRARVPPAAFSLGPVIPADDQPGRDNDGDGNIDPDADGLVEQAGIATFGYSDLVLQQANEWIVPVNFTEDFKQIRNQIKARGRFDESFGIRLDSLHLRLIAANEDWVSPTGTFELEALVQPGLLSNVQQGFGFVGAGYVLETFWLPSDEVLRSAGFTIPPPPQ